MTRTNLPQVLGTLVQGKAFSLQTVMVTLRRSPMNEHVVVLDKKGEGGESEYADLVQLMGGKLTPLGLSGSGELLDPRVVGGGVREMQGKRQTHPMEAVAHIAHDDAAAIEMEALS